MVGRQLAAVVTQLSSHPALISVMAVSLLGPLVFLGRSLMLRGFPGWVEIQIWERWTLRDVATDPFSPSSLSRMPKRGSASLHDACILSFSPFTDSTA